MSTIAERRRTYVPTRVLIDSGKILDTTFDDGDLYFTGPQIELMRNLIQYANRPDSYVSDYEPGYYLTPDDADWDEIQAIVADLEETLMGNPNTLWGYAAIWDEDFGGVATGAVWSAETTVIPVGEVRVLQAVSVRNMTRETTSVGLYLVRASTAVVYLEFTTLLAWGLPLLSTGMYTLAPGDRVYVYMAGCQAGDTIHGGIVGYKMSVSA